MPFIENKIGDFVFMSASNIEATHAFSTRFGGVSQGIFKSMNFGLNRGDDPNCVQRNYETLTCALCIDTQQFAFSHQVHGNDIRLVSKKDMLPPLAAIPYEADGLMTNEYNVPLVISTADCVPILLYDPVQQAIAAVHAGWRGTVADITGNAVCNMTQCFGSKPSDIRAAIGPCLSACCFETKADVKDAVYQLLGSSAVNFVTRRRSHFMVDLKGINRLLLEHDGVLAENIEISPECTSCSREKYWSHRATKGQRGSQIAVIMLKGCII